ncbi:hypothetical protein V8C86DRAFT_2544756 [Haematococcus lacustris]
MNRTLGAGWVRAAAGWAGWLAAAGWAVATAAPAASAMGRPTGVLASATPAGEGGSAPEALGAGRAPQGWVAGVSPWSWLGEEAGARFRGSFSLAPAASSCRLVEQEVKVAPPPVTTRCRGRLPPTTACSPKAPSPPPASTSGS